MSALINKEAAKAKDDESMRISSSGGVLSLLAPGDLSFCFHRRGSRDLLRTILADYEKFGLRGVS